jgi:hypothetical protein
MLVPRWCPRPKAKRYCGPCVLEADLLVNLDGDIVDHGVQLVSPQDVPVRTIGLEHVMYTIGALHDAEGKAVTIAIVDEVVTGVLDIGFVEQAHKHLTERSQKLIAISENLGHDFTDCD